MAQSSCPNSVVFSQLIRSVRRCDLCANQLPHKPNPVIKGLPSARLLIIGQAPGTKVHQSGIPWDDASGNRLRAWLNMSKERFYNESQVAIMPMGFCYPGKGKTGDLAPRPECAPQWHTQLLPQFSNVQLTLLIGLYAQKYYLQARHTSVTENVKQWQSFLPKYFVLPHPSPRNQLWMKKNLWFAGVIQSLQGHIDSLF